MDEKKTSWLYRVVRWLVWLFSPKFRVEGAERLPEEPCIIVGNHSQMFGPIAGEVFLPDKPYIWCAGEMMHRDEIAAYAYRDFWSKEPRAFRWLFRLLSHLIVPLAMLIFHNARTIGVYHDARLISTFRESIQILQGGRNVLIFPECYDEHNDIVHAFQEKFVDLARMYYRKTGKALRFVPLYVAPELKTLFYGEPVVFDPEAPIEAERTRICAWLMDQITAIAQAQPLHRVVPYPNLPRRAWPTNLPSEVKKMKRQPSDHSGSSLMKRQPYDHSGSSLMKRQPSDHSGSSLIKRQPYDYSGFSLTKLNEPRFSHALLLLGWIFYFTMYFITEDLIPAERCHPIHCALDDLIPFNEGFVFFYVGWYFLVFGSLIYTFFYHVEGFKKLQIFIITTQVVAMACYVIWPSRQDLRPEVFPRENVLTALMGFIYSFDTSTGVCPSLHVGYSLGILSVALKDRELAWGWKTALAVFVVMICVSVCFVKQHSALDVVAALPLGLLAEIVAYGKSYWLPRLRHEPVAD
ncbi:MAG: hypothetical protein IK095_09785 [Oscillospiraceae bacterium]|nr:hypothetical protein [Oscillospiraceae bacterium]